MFRLPGNLKLPATVAVFDCGTNSVLLLVARLLKGGRLAWVFETAESPRLGKGLAGRAGLKPQAVVRTFQALQRLFKEASPFRPDYLVAVGTDVFRRARNGKEIARRFAEPLGIPFFILSAEEEARLEFLGAVKGLNKRGREVVVDVGGGSSEIIWGQRRKIKKKISLEIGAVRLLESLPRVKRYNDRIIREMKEKAGKRIERVVPFPGYLSAILTGGTATTLATYSPGLKLYCPDEVHGLKTSRGFLEKQAKKLARMTLAERKSALFFDPARADIIVPGSIILCEILRRLEIEEVVISHRGLRWGVLYSYFS